MVSLKMLISRTIYVFCFHLLHMTLVVGESFHMRRNHSDQAIETSHVNEVKNRVDAEMILSKYGYLRCRVVERRKRDVLSSISSSFSSSWNSEPLTEGGGHNRCDEKEVEQAILAYQRKYNLPQTGRVDKETKSLMSTSRCGNTDKEKQVDTDELGEDVILDKVDPKIEKTLDVDEDNSDEDSSTEKTKPRIWKRSVGSSLFNIVKRDEPKTRGFRYLQKHLADYEEKIRHEAKGNRKLLRRYTPKERRKRSFHAWAKLPLHPEDRNGEKFNKDVIRWRLLDTGFSNRIPVNDQRATINLAFRMWSEVVPLSFIEDTRSNIHSVDIEIAFGRESHQNCNHDFDGHGGEIAHSWATGAMHFDDSENFKSIRAYGPDGLYLLRVAVHEIGHVLGLYHTNKTDSIMYAIYRGTQLTPTFELSKADRKEIQGLYGVCKGKFNTVFDWVRKSPEHQFIYNTYFFRGNHYWMYENYANRTRYGDPLYIAREWEGVPNNIDGYVHVWLYNGAVVDDIYFFKGEMYYKYDNANDKVFDGWPHKIQDGFGPKLGSDITIPNNLDSVFFDLRDENLYFFKNDDVYVYDPTATGDEKGCCVRKAKITDEFPSAPGEEPLPGNLDAVYYSYRDKMMYFLKGERLWRNALFDPRQRHPRRKRIRNRIESMGSWYNKFYDICDVDVTPKGLRSVR